MMLRKAWGHEPQAKLTTTPARARPGAGATMPNYSVREFKPFFNEESEPRIFCGDCLKPRKMYADDLEDLLSRSDFCHCERSGHA